MSTAAVKSFRKVMFGAMSRVDLATPPVQAATSAKFAEFINSAVKLAWEFYPWPEVTKVLPEAVIAHPTMDGAKYIPRITSARHINKVSAAYTTNPLVDRYAQGIELTELDDGFYLSPGTAPSSLWLNYRPAPPEYTSTLHVQASAYESDDLVWEGNTAGKGNVFRALQAVPVNTVLTSTVHWVAVPIYSRLAEAVMAGCIGAYHASKGNHGTTRVKIEYMQELLEHEITLLTN